MARALLDSIWPAAGTHGNIWPARTLKSNKDSDVTSFRQCNNTTDTSISFSVGRVTLSAPRVNSQDVGIHLRAFRELRLLRATPACIGLLATIEIPIRLRTIYRGADIEMVSQPWRSDALSIQKPKSRHGIIVTRIDVRAAPRASGKHHVKID